ncbi:hypothetical protein [Streptomyces megasporus]|uniref:hypothetical protein n=1 Tax=Streptomyces megasporus TaxID=44060 RepID=UPI0004E13706|nr:hypothetical protein [Streptomyces megasporus]
MDIVVVPLLLPVCGVLWAVRRLLLYPAPWGEWRYAFGAEHREARQALHDARRRKRTVEGEHRRKVAMAERRLADIGRSGAEGVRALEREKKELAKKPERGEQVGELGPLRLHRHVLLFLRETPEGEEAPEPEAVDGEMPLAGLAVRTESTSENTFIHLTRPDGTRRTAAYPRTRHREAAVRHFADLVRDKALADEAFHVARRKRAAEIDARIKQLKADTAAREEAARREIDELVEARRTDTRRAEADDAWQTECAVWQALTGRRPRWWWRW